MKKNSGSRVVLEPAFVLHRRPYRNTSWILELFTANYGRVSVIARSARGLKSRYKGRLELFSPLLVSWFGARDLKTLGNIELNSMPYLLSGESLLCGFYLNELLLRLLHYHDPHYQLFSDYQTALTRLSRPDPDLLSQPLPIILRCFEKRLLSELGFGLPLQCDSETGLPIESDSRYAYFPERGFSCKASVTEMTVSDKTFSGKTFSGKSLLACREEDFSDNETHREIKRLMQLALGRLLGHKPLKSRELFR